MIFIPLLNSAFQFATKIPRIIANELEYVQAQSDEKERLNFAKNVLEYLDQNNIAIDVNYIWGGYEGRKDTEFQVSILYSTIHWASGNFVEQHKTFCFDFSSWKALQRDVKSLSGIYNDIYVSGGDCQRDELEQYWKGIEKFQKYAALKAEQLREKQMGRQP